MVEKPSGEDPAKTMGD